MTHFVIHFISRHWMWNALILWLLWISKYHYISLFLQTPTRSNCLWQLAWKWEWKGCIGQIRRAYQRHYGCNIVAIISLFDSTFKNTNTANSVHYLVFVMVYRCLRYTVRVYLIIAIININNYCVIIVLPISTVQISFNYFALCLFIHCQFILPLRLLNVQFSVVVKVCLQLLFVLEL